MKAERIGAETTLSQIVQMVAQAQRSRAPMQRLADVVARWFVLAVIAIAVLTFLVWRWFGLHHAHIVAIQGDSYRLREKRRAGFSYDPIR